MARKTQKRSKSHTSKKGNKHNKSDKSEKSNNKVMTIPELRRSFEHMEVFAKQHARTKDAVSAFQEEWLRVFKKKLDKKAAAVYIKHVQGGKQGQAQEGGGVLHGAPLDYDTRPGLYISPGVNEGSYARVPNYVQSGFWNPEMGQSYDKVPGQTSFPTRTPFGLGDNTVIGMKGGNRTKTNKKQQKGGSTDPLTRIGTALNQFLFRPVGSSVPPSLAQDIQTGLQGKPLGASPNPAQNHLNYKMSNQLHSGNLEISPITAHLKTDIRRN